MANDKLFKSRSKVTVNVTYSKSMIPLERSCHKEDILKVGQRSRSMSHIQNL